MDGQLQHEQQRCSTASIKLHDLQGHRHGPCLHLRPFAETWPSDCCVCEERKTSQRMELRDTRLR